MFRRSPAASFAPASVLAVVALVLALVLACGGSSPSAPTDTKGGSSLDSAFAAARQQPNLNSLVVSQHGTILRQEFFNGGGANVAQDVRSVTKSVMSLLIGIALDRGCLKSLDSTARDVLGPLGPAPDSAKAPVTVRHLITMSSGIGGDELLDINEYTRWFNAPNQLAYVWDQPLSAAPGARFTYYSPAYAVLSPILTVACGQPTVDFARERLFGPLGLAATGWQLDRQGFANGAAGLMLTPLDMVAIGNLVLSEGHVSGQQVVPATWIREATRPQIATTAMPYVSGYGYGWWSGRTAAGADYTMAVGWGGQFILVVPRLELVVTAASRWQTLSSATAGPQWQAIADIIMQRIVPTF